MVKEILFSVCLERTKNVRSYVLLKNAWVPCIVYWTCKYFFQQKKTLKLGPTALFTHLKIILLQYFQFSTISGIQTDPQFPLRLHFTIYKSVNILDTCQPLISHSFHFKINLTHQMEPNTNLYIYIQEKLRENPIKF